MSCFEAFPKIWDEMESIRKSYLVCHIKMDSAHLGEPVQRRRIYFILIRRLVDFQRVL